MSQTAPMLEHEKIRDELIRQLEAKKIKAKDVAAALGVDASRVTEMRKYQRRVQPEEMEALAKFLKMDVAKDASPVRSESADHLDYVDVAVLPTFAGMGGGGNGEGDRETALISSSLIHHELRGRPSDFLLINVRGDSMEPDFRHGDQLLIDTRDTSPAQPGPFALWDGEWGEYVVKNVERAEGGRVRMFSTNTKYAPSEIDHEATRIIGRPVWFARRL